MGTLNLPSSLSLYSKRFNASFTQGNSYLEKIADIQRGIRAIWEAPLRVESFGVDGRSTGGALSVDWEVDSLTDFLKLMCFYDSSEAYIRARRAFITDYAAPTFSDESLKRSIIPTYTHVRRAVDNVAMLYKVSPDRWLSTPALTAEYQMVLRESGYNRAMKRAHRLATLTNYTPVRPYLDNNLKMRIAVHTPDRTRVQLDGEGEVVKFLYHDKAWVNTKNGREYINVVYVWTPEEHYMLDPHGDRIAIPGNEDMVNPYGIIPAVFIVLDDVEDLYAGGQYDLVSSSIEYNYYKLLQITDATFSALNVTIATNLDMPENALVSPRDFIAIEGAMTEPQLPPSLDVVSGTPHAELLAELASRTERESLQRTGLPSFILADTPAELSGKAMKIAMSELLEKRQNDAEIMEGFERQIYAVMARISQVGNDKGKHAHKLPENEELNLDYPEIDYGDMTLIEEYEYDKTLMRDGIRGLGEFIRKYNSDVGDDEEALQLFDQYKAQNARFSGRTNINFVNGILNGQTGQTNT